MSRREPSGPPPLSVVGTRAAWAPRVAGFLEPGETVDVVVPARTGLSRQFGTLLDTELLVGQHRGRNCLLVATDRAWLPVIRGERDTEPMEPGPRCPRDVRLDTSGWRRFTGLDRPYAVDPAFADHVRAANDALEARAAGRPWRLEDCGDWVLADPRRSRGLVRSAVRRLLPG